MEASAIPILLPTVFITRIEETYNHRVNESECCWFIKEKRLMMGFLNTDMRKNATKKERGDL